MRYVLLLVISLSLHPFSAAQDRTDSISRKVHKLDEVVIVENQARQKNLLSPYTGIISMNAEHIRNLSSLFGEADVLKALQTYSGVSAGVEGFSGMYVRGGDNDENLYVLHGLPLYHVNHLGGLFSSFNVSAIDKVDFYKSGFPVSFGGRISSITDISLKEGDYEKYGGQASLGLLSGNVFVTGPIKKDKAAVSVGMRRSWLDILTVPTLAVMNKMKEKDGKKDIGRYAFTDFNVKLDYKARNIKGYTQFYWGKDYLKVGEELFLNENLLSYKEANMTQMKWGNRGLSSGAVWKKNDVQVTLNGYYTHYEADFGQEQTEFSSEDKVTSNDFVRKRNTNGIHDLGTNMDVSYTLSEHFWFKTGIHYTYHNYYPEKVVIESNADNFGSPGPASGKKVKAHETAAYMDTHFLLSEQWRINCGIRGVFYSSSGRKHWVGEPRLNLRYSPGKNFSVKVGYSRMTQFVQQICNSYISLPTDSWLPVSNKWKPLTSDQISVGWYGNLPFGFYFSVEGYYKWMNNLLEYKEGIHSFSLGADWSDKLTSGQGRAYGVDVNIYRNVGRVTGSIGYGLLWNRRRFDDLNKGKSFPSKYDNRHKLNIACNYKLSERVELNAGWTYASGNRVTLALYNYHGMEGSGFPEDMAPSGIIQTEWGLDYYSGRNNVKLPAYHRLDIGIDIRKNLKKNRQGIWNVSLYNAYSRMNPIAINKKTLENIHGEEGRWSSRFRTLGIFPVIPSVSYTYIF